MFLIVADVALFGVIAWQTNATGSNLRDEASRVLPNVAPIVLAGLGMTGIVCCGSIDLSIGAILGLSGTMFGILYERGFSPATCFAACFATSFVVSTYNGFLVRSLRLPAIIVTLAGLQVARGLALVISNNQYINISYGDGPGLAPPVFAILGDRLFNNTVPVATLVFVVVAVVAVFVLNFTRFGRYVFAVGGNERAARLSGVPVRMVKISVYAITGLVSAIAGIVHAGQFNFGSANDGTGYELMAIAAVVIGGTSLFGGAGSLVGTVAGAVMLGALANILQLNNINAALQLLATGAIIVLAAVLQSLVSRREGLGR